MNYLTNYPFFFFFVGGGIFFIKIALMVHYLIKLQEPWAQNVRTFAGTTTLVRMLPSVTAPPTNQPHPQATHVSAVNSKGGGTVRRCPLNRVRTAGTDSPSVAPVTVHMSLGSTPSATRQMEPATARRTFIDQLEATAATHVTATSTGRRPFTATRSLGSVPVRRMWSEGSVTSVRINMHTSRGTPMTT